MIFFSVPYRKKGDELFFFAVHEQDPQLFWWMGNQICHQEQQRKNGMKQ